MPILVQLNMLGIKLEVLVGVNWNVLVGVRLMSRCTVTPKKGTVYKGTVHLNQAFWSP